MARLIKINIWLNNSLKVESNAQIKIGRQN